MANIKCKDNFQQVSDSKVGSNSIAGDVVSATKPSDVSVTVEQHASLKSKDNGCMDIANAAGPTEAQCTVTNPSDMQPVTLTEQLECHSRAIGNAIEGFDRSSIERTDGHVSVIQNPTPVVSNIQDVIRSEDSHMAIIKGVKANSANANVEDSTKASVEDSEDTKPELSTSSSDPTKESNIESSKPKCHDDLESITAIDSRLDIQVNNNGNFAMLKGNELNAAKGTSVLLSAVPELKSGVNETGLLSGEKDITDTLMCEGATVCVNVPPDDNVSQFQSHTSVNEDVSAVSVRMSSTSASDSDDTLLSPNTQLEKHRACSSAVNSSATTLDPQIYEENSIEHCGDTVLRERVNANSKGIMSKAEEQSMHFAMSVQTYSKDTGAKPGMDVDRQHENESKTSKAVCEVSDAINGEAVKESILKQVDTGCCQVQLGDKVYSQKHNIHMSQGDSTGILDHSHGPDRSNGGCLKVNVKDIDIRGSAEPEPECRQLTDSSAVKDIPNCELPLRSANSNSLSPAGDKTREKNSLHQKPVHDMDRPLDDATNKPHCEIPDSTVNRKTIAPQNVSLTSSNDSSKGDENVTLALDVNSVSLEFALNNNSDNMKDTLNLRSQLDTMSQSLKSHQCDKTKCTFEKNLIHSSEIATKFNEKADGNTDQSPNITQNCTVVSEHGPDSTIAFDASEQNVSDILGKKNVTCDNRSAVLTGDKCTIGLSNESVHCRGSGMVQSQKNISDNIFEKMSTNDGVCAKKTSPDDSLDIPNESAHVNVNWDRDVENMTRDIGPDFCNIRGIGTANTAKTLSSNAMDTDFFLDIESMAGIQEYDACISEQGLVNVNSGSERATNGDLGETHNVSNLSHSQTADSKNKDGLLNLNNTGLDFMNLATSKRNEPSMIQCSSSHSNNKGQSIQKPPLLQTGSILDIENLIPTQGHGCSEVTFTAGIGESEYEMMPEVDLSDLVTEDEILNTESLDSTKVHNNNSLVLADDMELECEDLEEDDDDDHACFDLSENEPSKSLNITHKDSGDCGNNNPTAVPNETTNPLPENTAKSCVSPVQPVEKIIHNTVNSEKHREAEVFNIKPPKNPLQLSEQSDVCNVRTMKNVKNGQEHEHNEADTFNIQPPVKLKDSVKEANLLISRKDSFSTDLNLNANLQRSFLDIRPFDHVAPKPLEEPKLLGSAIDHAKYSEQLRSPMQYPGPTSPHQGQAIPSPHIFQESASHQYFQGSLSPHAYPGHHSPLNYKGYQSPHHIQGSSSPHHFQGSLSPRQFQGHHSPHHFHGHVSPYQYPGYSSPHHNQGHISPHFPGHHSPHHLTGHLPYLPQNNSPPSHLRPSMSTALPRNSSFVELSIARFCASVRQELHVPFQPRQFSPSHSSSSGSDSYSYYRNSPYSNRNSPFSDAGKYGVENHGVKQEPSHLDSCSHTMAPCSNKLAMLAQSATAGFVDPQDGHSAYNMLEVTKPPDKQHTSKHSTKTNTTKQVGKPAKLREIKPKPVQPVPMANERKEPSKVQETSDVIHKTLQASGDRLIKSSIAAHHHIPAYTENKDKFTTKAIKQTVPQPSTGVCEKGSVSSKVSLTSINNDVVTNRDHCKKTHVCDHCGKSFSKFQVLRIHYRTHELDASGETALECSPVESKPRMTGPILNIPKLPLNIPKVANMASPPIASHNVNIQKTQHNTTSAIGKPAANTISPKTIENKAASNNSVIPSTYHQFQPKMSEDKQIKHIAYKPVNKQKHVFGHNSVVSQKMNKMTNIYTSGKICSTKRNSQATLSKVSSWSAVNDPKLLMKTRVLITDIMPVYRMMEMVRNKRRQNVPSKGVKYVETGDDDINSIGRKTNHNSKSLQVIHRPITTENENPASDELEYKNIDVKFESVIQPLRQAISPHKQQKRRLKRLIKTKLLFHCMVCSKNFSSKAHLEVHKRQHTGAQPHKCPKCEQSFTFASSLSNHLVQVHNHKTPYSCKICKKTFMHKRNIRVHHLIHSGKLPHKCDVCGRGFPFESYLRKHSLVHSKERPYPCELCDKRFKKKAHCAAHQLTHFNRRPHSCDLCGRCFAFASYIRIHKQICHSNRKPYECSTCHKRFSIMGGLRIHQIVHTRQKRYQCHLCMRNFSYHNGLAYHMRSTHTFERPYSCAVCNKSFPSLSYLTIHKRLHTGEKPYSCKMCNKSFTQRPHLRAHMNFHLGNRPYKCQECGKGFTQSSHLKTHQRLHTGERSYSCDICDKSFTHKGTLTSHMRQHTGEKPYQCAICPMTFTQLHALKLHQATTGHKTPGLSDLKPLHCPHCDKVFYFKTILTKHIQVKHITTKLFHCTCGKSFHHRESLKNHTCAPRRVEKTKCEKCGKLFSSLATLCKHINTMHKGHHQIHCHQCSLCKLVFGSKKTLQYHIEAIHGPQDIQAGVYKSSGVTTANVKVPLFNKPKNDPVECDLCGMTLATKKTLKYHKRRKHPESIGWPVLFKQPSKEKKPPRCEYCNKKFSTLTNVKRHIAQQHWDEREDWD